MNAKAPSAVREKITMSGLQNRQKEVTDQMILQVKGCHDLGPLDDHRPAVW